MGVWDPRRNAWILDSPSDVAAALRDPRLVPAQARSAAPVAALDPAAHAEFRTQALQALSPAVIQQWEERFELAAAGLVGELTRGERVDLIERYARPYSLQVAAITTGAFNEELERLAANIFAAACEPYDEELAARSQTSTIELATHFRSAPPWTVQMFAALTHSLPALLGNLWLGRLEQCAAISGPAKAVFRQAIERLTIGDCEIERNQRVILQLDGDTMFGAGIHSCVGAPLINSAVTIATRALFDRFELSAHEAVTVDRFAMRYLSSLTVELSPSNQFPPPRP